MKDNTPLLWIGVIGGTAALVQALWAVWRGFRGGEVRKGQAEAAKASLDAVQAEASLPFVQKSLELGNVAEAVAIQQGIINGLREHAAWQDVELEKAHTENAELRKRLSERDAKVAALEERLGKAEKALNEARTIIEELREVSRAEHTEEPHR